MKEISAGGVVYYQEGDQALVLMIEDKCHRWTLPKGKIEDGETYAETAIREVEEETGIIGKVIKPLEKVYYEYYHPVHNKIEKDVYFYLIEASTKKVSVQLEEINAAEWLSLHDAWERQVKFGYDNNHELMKAALKFLGYEQA